MPDKEDASHDVRLAYKQEPFTLKPLIADILRTRFCVPGSRFLVEDITKTSVSSSGRWKAAQILLSDGELCIQALMSGHLYRYLDTGEVSVGCYVKVESFDIRRLTLQDKSEMVYLVVEDIITIGWNDGYRALYAAENVDSMEELASEHDLDVEEQQLEYRPDEVAQAQAAESFEQANEEDEKAFEDAFEAFEAKTFPLKTKLREQKPAPSSGAVALPKDWQNRQQPLRLTPLRSIPRLPYAQNWCCNVLAIVTSLSPVEASYLPPYRQRTARLADPSTSKQVHLTVFLEPDNFEPKTGSAVLLVGVKNHRFDGGSLKKYASDADKTGGGEWWHEDPLDLVWCDVAGIKEWWATVQAGMAA
ncbi:uncharacterized protein J7T54_005843 [Emericellopsis cladophorae]|uniref:Uncharacterized protein n=1 Tax=Emericellopsis cladophorae TaxID=2686198 RepID=A0A9Q0BAG9_9HYPO|nr:uncharacterized protein J7T54_005843 [Emericellopsis cladophorae]KAI6778327.1 hypothetical protein J7T54_005843 [Emericellopsis cladophorae]